MLKPEVVVPKRWYRRLADRAFDLEHRRGDHFMMAFIATSLTIQLFMMAFIATSLTIQLVIRFVLTP